MSHKTFKEHKEITSERLRYTEKKLTEALQRLKEASEKFMQPHHRPATANEAPMQDAPKK